MHHQRVFACLFVRVCSQPSATADHRSVLGPARCVMHPKAACTGWCASKQSWKSETTPDCYCYSPFPQHHHFRFRLLLGQRQKLLGAVEGLSDAPLHVLPHLLIALQVLFKVILGDEGL